MKSITDKALPNLAIDRQDNALPSAVNDKILNSDLHLANLPNTLTDEPSLVDCLIEIELPT
jgi:hypothetical protein